MMKKTFMAGLCQFYIAKNQKRAIEDKPFLKRYTLFAGVNGAGKISLYYAAYENNDSTGERINIDEIVRKSGNWKDTKLQIEAGKTAIALIKQYVNKGVSFHQETTLSGRYISRTIW